MIGLHLVGNNFGYGLGLHKVESNAKKSQYGLLLKALSRKIIVFSFLKYWGLYEIEVQAKLCKKWNAHCYGGKMWR